MFKKTASAAPDGYDYSTRTERLRADTLGAPCPTP